MGRKHKSFPEENDKSRELRKKIKEQEAEIKRLKSELKTLNMAFTKMASYIKGNLEDLTVDRVIDGVRKNKTMVETIEENLCPDCNAEIKFSKLPFGELVICSKACGWRKVTKDEEN